MSFNGWFTPSMIKAVLVAIFLMGAWVTAIQADITALDTSKADKIDVVRQQAVMTQILISIDDKLGDLKDSVKDIDVRQRDISKDVAALKADE